MRPPGGDETTMRDRRNPQITMLAFIDSAAAENGENIVAVLIGGPEPDLHRQQAVPSS